MPLYLLIISSLFVLQTYQQSYSILQDYGLKKIPDDAKLNPQQLVQKFGYPFEEHDVTTEDGYILKVFRIKHGKQSKTTDPNPNPVFLQHGLLATGHCWIANADLSPAFMLANAGFDVWIGNNRGTYFGRRHQTLNPDKDNSFWEFTFVDFARYDVKGQIEYVRNQTGKKVGYVGHSQGTIQMFAALSENEDWLSQKVKAYAAVAPVARVGNMDSTLLQFLAHSQIAPLVNSLGFHQFLPRNWIINTFSEWACSDIPVLCKIAIYLILDSLPIQDNMVQTAVALSYMPAGTSVLNMNHWSQLVTSKKFQYFDFGQKLNQEKYGQDTPPIIDLSKLNKVPIGIFSGKADELADPKDVEWLIGVLDTAGVMKFNKQYEDGHLTFIIGTEMSYVADLITFLKSYDEVVDKEFERV